MIVRHLAPPYWPGTLPNWIAAVIDNVIYASARTWLDPQEAVLREGVDDATTRFRDA
jgi:hypothetical protein